MRNQVQIVLHEFALHPNKMTHPPHCATFHPLEPVCMCMCWYVSADGCVYGRVDVYSCMLICVEMCVGMSVRPHYKEWQ